MRREAPDFLDELIAKRTKKNPAFSAMVDAAYRRRELLRKLVATRSAKGLTQKDVADHMQTSQAAVARIESGDIDVRGTTLDRYALAVGKEISYSLREAKTA